MEEELNEYRPQRYQNRLGYLEESWKPEYTCYRSDFSEKPPGKTGVKKPRGEKW